MTQQAGHTVHLKRGMGFWGAMATNVLNMVGVGPFLTIPLALAAMGGPQAMLGWVLGAVLACCDGMVWAELGSRFPDSGGPYFFLLEGFNRRTYGRVMAFLFLWQSLLIGPISIASGAVGFADYAAVLHPLSPWALKGVAVAVCLLNIGLLYRSISSISALSVVVAVAVLATCAWIIFSGALNFRPAVAFDFPQGAFHLTRGFWLGLGSATLIATYDYGGYGNICLIGGEVRQPQRTIPRTVLLSIALVAIMYLAMNVSIISVVPWREGQHSHAIVADFMQAIYGSAAAKVASVMILVASWGSAFAILLGYSRIPYAAAVDDTFPKLFARVHPRGHFPTVSLLYMGFASVVMCLFTLETLIAALIVVQTMLQFMAQCVAVILLRRRQAVPGDVYRMPLFPLPALIALLGWLYIVATSKLLYIGVGSTLAALGVGFYLFGAARRQEWPFQRA